MNLKEKFAQVAVKLPEIYFPKEGTDLQKFACVACDQYSAQPEYWEDVEKFVGDAPSTLRLMMPEAWIGKKDAHQAAIPSYMEKYTKDGTLQNIGEGLVYLQRGTTSGVRQGLVVALDLEEYEFLPGSKALIRSTEKTVVERLPIRIEIRKQVPLELPHIMILISDKENRLFDMLKAETAGRKPLYSFDTMKNSGHLSGWFVQDEELLSKIADELLVLKDNAQDGMVYAMGDGNHSFAAAKAHWDELKKTLSPEERENHPARYGLCEIVNLYDKALEFEPIHRLLMNVDGEALQKELGFDALNPPSLQDLQPKLDAWLSTHKEAEIEYIHGKKDCLALGKKPGCLAIVWDKFDKDSLFSDVAKHGVLCRKSFSMGSAPDKRFYLECRKITR